MDKMRTLGWNAVGIDSDPKVLVLARDRGLEVYDGDIFSFG